jgi:hypothetical protein
MDNAEHLEDCPFAAILGKLPKTRDDVFVVPGEDTVYAAAFPSGNGTTSRMVPLDHVVAYQVESCQPQDAEYDYILPHCVHKCWSTLAKAQEELNSRQS